MMRMMTMRRLRMMMRMMMRRLRRKEKIRDGGRLLLLATMLPGKLQLWSHGHWLYSGFLTTMMMEMVIVFSA